MAYPTKKKKKGNLVKIRPKDYRMGAAGNLGLIGGAGKGIVKIGKKVFKKIAKKVALNKMSNRKKKKKSNGKKR